MSTSPVQKTFKYDVFLSFRGKDTCRNVVDHLYDALDRQGIHTFKEFKSLEKGKRISDQIAQSVEDSRLYIIVFSKKYASSLWCLNELLKIMECQKKKERTAYPVFYDVEPTEVRRQSGSVGEALSIHKNESLVERWREALKEATNLSGWYLRKTADGHEAQVIRLIVEEVSRQLRLFNVNFDEKLAGIEQRMQDVEPFPKISLEDVRMRGTKGIGGGGKTTLARAIFDTRSTNLHRVSRDSNMRTRSLNSINLSEELKRLNGLTLYECSDVKIKNDSIDIAKSYQKSLQLFSWEKYLHTSGLSNLVSLNMPFSRIVWLWERGERKVLNNLRFLSLNYSMLRTFDLRVALNLKVLQLAGCHDLVELRLPYEILNLKFLILRNSKLRILNFGRAPHLEKLDLGGCHDLVKLHLPYEILNLKFLILRNSKLRILNFGRAPHLEKLDLGGCHDLVELHLPYEILNLKFLILRNSKLRILNFGRAPHLEKLDLGGCHDLVELHLPYEILNLKFLILRNSKLRILNFGRAPHLEKLHLGGCHDLVELHLPVEILNLRVLTLSNLKLRTRLDFGLAPNLELLELEECQDLAELHMLAKCSKLGSLKISNSWLKTLDFTLILNLKSLTLVDCYDMVELRIPIQLEALYLFHSLLKTLDLGQAVNLAVLDLKNCHDLVELDLSHSKLRIFDLRLFPNLEKLNLEESHDLVELYMPDGCPKLMSLDLSHSKLGTLDLGRTSNLKWLNLQDCYDLIELQIPIGCMKRLVFLNLSGCSKMNSFSFIKELKALEVLILCRLYLKEFPDIISLQADGSLLEFHFRYNDIEELPSSIANLDKLVYLDLHSCRKLRSLPGSICRLRHLRNLKLYGCSIEGLPEDIDRLECLEKLNLSFTRIKHLPDSVCMLKHLKTLNLSSCWNLEKLPENLSGLACLQKLILTECTQVKEIPDSICKLKTLKHLSLLDCILLQNLPEELGCLESLEVLNVEGTRIRDLPWSISLLKNLTIYGPKSGIRMRGSPHKTP